MKKSALLVAMRGKIAEYYDTAIGNITWVNTGVVINQNEVTDPTCPSVNYKVTYNAVYGVEPIEDAERETTKHFIFLARKTYNEITEEFELLANPDVTLTDADRHTVALIEQLEEKAQTWVSDLSSLPESKRLVFKDWMTEYNTTYYSVGVLIYAEDLAKNGAWIVYDETINELDPDAIENYEGTHVILRGSNCHPDEIEPVSRLYRIDVLSGVFHLRPMDYQE